jgi:hypothetical protein
MPDKCAQMSAQHEPRTEIMTTPNSVLNNPELSTPDNPELSSPEDFNHHHQVGRIKEESSGVVLCCTDAESVNSVQNGVTETDKCEPPASVKATTPNGFTSSPDDGRHKRKPLDSPIEEFRTRLQERAWQNGTPELEGIVVMVREALGYSFPRIRRFLDFEAPLTTPEKVRNPGAHYRTLLKSFLASEPNTRLEEDKKRQPAGSAAWHCGFGRCRGGIISDADAQPLDVCECPSTQALYRPEQREKFRSEIAQLRAMRGLPKGENRHFVSSSRVA